MSKHSNPGNNMNQSQIDNRANQLNPNNDAYWTSRGYESRDDAEYEDYEEDY